MKRSLISLIVIFIWVYCGIAFFDPGDSIIRAKLPVFAVILALFLWLKMISPAALPRELLSRIFLLVCLIPGISLVIFIIRHPGQNLSESFSLVKGLAAILLILPAAAAADLKKPVLVCTGIMTAGIIGLRYCAAYDPRLYDKISLFLIDHSGARIGSRHFGEIDVAMIYFATTPLVILVVPFLMQLIFGGKVTTLKRMGALLFLGLILTAVLFSAARALTAVLLLECFACFLFINRRRLMLVTWSLALAGIFLVTGLVMVQRTGLLSADEQSNSIKIAHFESFLAFINDHPAVLLTGDGLGATYFTHAPEVNQEVYQTELTYLDTVRYFGLAGSLIFLALLFMPLLLPGSNGLWIIGLLSYFIVAGNNPLLFNSTGMLAVVFFWSQQVRSAGSGNKAAKPTTKALAGTPAGAAP